MYKNFTLTEEEKKEILGLHHSNGYGRPKNVLSEQTTYNTSNDYSLYSKYPCIEKTATKNNWARFDENGDGKIDKIVANLSSAGTTKNYYPNGTLVLVDFSQGKNTQTKSTYGCKGNGVVDSFIKNPKGKVYADVKNPFTKVGANEFIPWYTKDGNGGKWITNLQKKLIEKGFLRIKAPTGFMGNMTKAAVLAAVKKYNSGQETNQTNGITKSFYNDLMNLKPGQ